MTVEKTHSRSRCKHDPCTCNGSCVFDDRSWIKFYVEVAPKVNKYFFVRLKDQDACDDCLQETIKRVLESIYKENFDSSRPLVPYLWGIAKKVLADYLKAAHYSSVSSIPLHDCDEIIPECQNDLDKVEAQEEIEKITRFAGLSMFEAEVFCLKVVHGFRRKDIAFVTDSTENQVKNALYRACIKVKRRITNKDVLLGYWTLN
jgi:RNA polymerase sigma factor (sigma-70 family)